LVGVETGGDWLSGFLGTHNVGRFLKPMEGHRGSIFYYLFAIALGFFPWSWFLLPSLLELGARIRRSHEWASCLFVACWAGFYIGFFSLARTKLPSYVLPAYPALALLTAVFVDHWLSAPRQLGRWMPATGMAGMALSGAAFLIAFPLAAPYLLPGEEAIGWIGASLLAGGLAALAFAWHGLPRRAAIAMVVASVAFATGLFGFASVRASRGQNGASLIAFLRQADPAPLRLATFEYNAPSLVFYARQPVGQFHQKREASQFFAAHGNAYLITRAECLERLRPALPADVQELTRQPRFLRRGEELVVLGRPARMAQSKRRNPL
jgi:4-amino-4-deoxy-L-arabinose transferase-like glycosyltransferase